MIPLRVLKNHTARKYGGCQGLGGEENGELLFNGIEVQFYKMKSYGDG